MSTPARPEEFPLSIPRRHDLDAVRAFAMLLGIVLHAGLSFGTIPWIVQDLRRHDGFSLVFQAIHGFRMPLFFLVSGFFTAMLWQRRGLRALLRQRAMRILLPLALGLLTVIPATNAVYAWAIMSAIDHPAARTDDGTLISAIRLGDATLIHDRLADNADVNAVDSQFGVTPLAWAVLRGDVETTRLLIDRGADVMGRNRDGATPLHGAAFLGKVKAAELLLDKGADPLAKSLSGDLPIAATRADWGITDYIASLLDLPLADREEVENGRQEVARILTEKTKGNDAGGAAAVAGTPPAGGLTRVLDAYQAAVTSRALTLGGGGQPFHLIQTPVFAHLWFLWFLCWLVSGFAAFAWVSERLKLGKLPRGLALSPWGLLWLIPLTLVPQYFMGQDGLLFGPDSSTGLIPLPHLLVYYGVFFAFGSLYFVADDNEGRLGRRWWLHLPCALFLALPLGVVTLPFRPITSVAQVLYAWMMCFGVMGLFRRFLNAESKAVRYVSDSSYWLYLIHLPLIVAAQVLVRDWSLPAIVKFTLICTTVTGILLFTYQTMVRYTWIGRMLNGRRTRPGRELAPAVSIGLETT